jgi:hypothetical protein
VTTNQEKLQELFEAALRSLDEPLPKPVPAVRGSMFPPPRWRVQEEDQAKPQVVPQEKSQV